MGGVAIASAAMISVQETLDLLDGPFASFAEGVAENVYALWLGSGISLGRVKGLKEVVRRVVELLRARVTDHPHCRFRAAVERVLQLASLSTQELGRVDLAMPFNEWPDANAITDRLVTNYARLLDIEVNGEQEDFLLWDGVDVVTTFADPEIEPDVEHICIAILILEGVASDIASANWDGLIERAVNLLAPGYRNLGVCVLPNDLREPDLASRLYKLHGCAVKAAEDEGTYRKYLVARHSQISGWVSRPEIKALVDRLVSLVTLKPTLIIGLSAQDANIQILFAEAQAAMKWPWPGERPSCVISGDALGFDQTSLLKNVYRDAYTPATREDIAQSALIRAYAKPLLVAIVLHVICSKLKKLIDLAPANLGAADRQRLHDGALAIRNMIASTATTDKMAFIKLFVEQNGRAISMFRDGQVRVTPLAYNAVTRTPVQKIADISLPSTGLSEAAVAVGILGLGAKAGDWTLEAGDTADLAAGVIRITGASASARVFFVADSHVAVKLYHNGHIGDDDRTIVIHSKEKMPMVQRSPRSAPGRTGRTGLRELSISSLLKESSTLDELVQRFREEVAA